MQVAVGMLCIIDHMAVLLDMDAAPDLMGARSVMHKKRKPEQIYKPFRKIFNHAKGKLKR